MLSLQVRCLCVYEYNHCETHAKVAVLWAKIGQGSFKIASRGKGKVVTVLN
jgi:hypothetical protein